MVTKVMKETQFGRKFQQSNTMYLLRALLFGENMPLLSSPSSPSPVLRGKVMSVMERNLTNAYEAFWYLPGTTPMETFQAAYREIVRLEAAAAPEVAWRTLREAAKAHHVKTLVCPFCREPGELHLPAEQIEVELRGEGREASFEL
jgi:hypothetical protein